MVYYAIEKLKEWHKKLPLYVYSSGSIKAQDLFFTYSDAGNIKGLFKGFFDTTSGGKKETQSYWNIAEAIGAKPEDILFLSDLEDEVTAAHAAGYQTCWLQREKEKAEPLSISPAAINFNEVDQLFFS